MPTMFNSAHSPLFSRALLSACLVLPLFTGIGACHAPGEADAERPRDGELADAVGASYAIVPSGPLSKEQIDSLAQYLQTQGVDVQVVKVRVLDDQEGEEPGNMTVAVELWGAEVPGPEIADALRSQFAFLADAQIAVTAPPDELDAPEPQAEIDPEDDPETIRQKVIDDLRAQGVEGDIQVEVIPTEDGHFKVEVHVEQQEEQ